MVEEKERAKSEEGYRNVPWIVVIAWVVFSIAIAAFATWMVFKPK